MWRELALPVPFPFLAFLFLCHQFISSYPGLPVMVCRSLPLSLCVFLPASSFSVSMSLPLVSSPCLSHPLLPFSLSSSVVIRVSPSSYLFPWVSLCVSCPRSPRLSRSLSVPSPCASPPPPPSARLPSPYLAGREGWREEAACGWGDGGRERGQTEEGGGWC